MMDYKSKVKSLAEAVFCKPGVSPAAFNAPEEFEPIISDYFPQQLEKDAAAAYCFEQWGRLAEKLNEVLSERVIAHIKSEMSKVSQ
jgi:hypothetical protein